MTSKGLPIGTNHGLPSGRSPLPTGYPIIPTGSLYLKRGGGLPGIDDIPIDLEFAQQQQPSFQLQTTPPQETKRLTSVVEVKSEVVPHSVSKEIQGYQDTISSLQQQLHVAGN